MVASTPKSSLASRKSQVNPATSPLSSAIDCFLEAKRVSNLSPKTLQNYSQELRRFATFTGEKICIAKDVSHYLSHCSERGISSNALASYFRTLRSFFNWCQRQRLVRRSPMATIEAPKEESRVVRPFSRDEIDQLSQVLRSNPDGFLATRNLTLLFLLLDTGLRVSEALNLRLDQLNESGLVRVLGKGSKERWVRLSPQVLHHIGDYLSHRNRLPARERCKSLFTTWDGRQLKPQGFRQALKDTAMGWKHVRVSPHTLRNTYGCWTAVAGMDTESIRVSMGHSSQAMTARYIEYAAVRRALLEHEKFNPLTLMENGVSLELAPVPEALEAGK